MQPDNYVVNMKLRFNIGLQFENFFYIRSLRKKYINDDAMNDAWYRLITENENDPNFEEFFRNTRAKQKVPYKKLRQAKINIKKL